MDRVRQRQQQLYEEQVLNAQRQAEVTEEKRREDLLLVLTDDIDLFFFRAMLRRSPRTRKEVN